MKCKYLKSWFDHSQTADSCAFRLTDNNSMVGGKKIPQKSSYTRTTNAIAGLVCGLEGIRPVVVGHFLAKWGGLQNEQDTHRRTHTERPSRSEKLACFFFSIFSFFLLRWSSSSYVLFVPASAMAKKKKSQRSLCSPASVAVNIKTS